MRPLENLFRLDLRSLAMLRIGLGALVLVDLAIRSTDFGAHYTDSGVLPAAALSLHGPRAEWSLHGFASSEPTAVAALFGLAAALGLALLLGFQGRLAAFLSWVLLASLQWRNPGLNQGGDVMLRMLLFWAMFLPLDARFSITARGRRGVPPSDGFVSLATVALLLQVCLVYWVTVLQRSGPLWWEGNALWYGLHYDQFTTGFGVWLRDYEALLPPLTWATLALEILGPLLLFVPVALGPVRTAAVVLFLGFHLGLALLMDLGLFPAVFCVAWLAFLPAWFWERLPRRLRPRAGAGERLHSRAWVQVLAGVALAYVVLANLDSLTGAVSRRLPAGWDAPARALSLDQTWKLFAPPPRHDGWYVFQGHQQDGTLVDPFHPERTPGWGKPERVSAEHGFRWRRYFFDMALQKQDPRWDLLGLYVCRTWNADHEGAEALDRLNVYYVRETTLPTGPERGETLLLHTRTCEREAGVR